MLKIRIHSIGKIKEKWLENAIDVYLKRLSADLTIEWLWSKDDKQLIQMASKEKLLIGLDPSAWMPTSEEFSKFFFKKLEEGGSKIAFVIGGANGLPAEIRQKFPLISLSKLTFTHQMIQIILVEQIYRALEIYRGSNYHKYTENDSKIGVSAVPKPRG